MPDSALESGASHPAAAVPASSPSAWDFIRLARPKQWVKGGFVLLGYFYGLKFTSGEATIAVALAFIAFGLASSGCYVFNDIRDREMDRVHPRKRNRPIAAGRIGPGTAMIYALVLWALAACAVALTPAPPGPLPADGHDWGGWSRAFLAGFLGLYTLNVVCYSLWFKRVAVLDVMSLASGFVLRVLGGCAAVGVAPSPWLLNCTFFVSMLLAFGKRLGERRTMGIDAAAARDVQSVYTDDLLRMMVGVTSVATLVSYSDYVQAQSELYTLGFNLLWLTMLPATFALLRCMLLLEAGVYDDPTELASRDRPFQAAVLLFGLLTAILLVAVRKGGVPGA